MKKIFFLMLIFCCFSCDNGKNEYIQSANNINKMLLNYFKEYGGISEDMANIAINDFTGISSYRAENQSEILELEKKASVVITEIDKLSASKYKCEKIDKLFQDMRHDIMESLYNVKYESGNYLFSDRAYTISTNQLRYMQQYDIELRSLVN